MNKRQKKKRAKRLKYLTGDRFSMNPEQRQKIIDASIQSRLLLEERKQAIKEKYTSKTNTKI